MFGRVINKIFKRDTPPKPTPEPESKDSAPGPPFGRNNALPKTAATESAMLPQPPLPKKDQPKGAPAKSSAPTKAADTVKQKWATKANEKLNPEETPEVLCGITKEMSQPEIAKKLATLYRRHNRAASSLDPQMREEAEVMLEAIATAKEKFLQKQK